MSNTTQHNTTQHTTRDYTVTTPKQEQAQHCEIITQISFDLALITLHLHNDSENEYGFEALK